MPKLDYLITDDIYVGALITVRKKSDYPVIYTDLTGKVIGVNSHVRCE
jgi:hypothetical protein